MTGTSPTPPGQSPHPTPADGVPAADTETEIEIDEWTLDAVQGGIRVSHVLPAQEAGKPISAMIIRREAI